METIAKRHIIVLVIALAALATACGSSGSSAGLKDITAAKAAEGTGTDATTGPSTANSPVTQATVAPTTAAPAPAPAPSGNLAGSWYGPQADNLAPTCQGSTTYTFSAAGQFSAATIYNPNSAGNCVNFTVSGTWSLTGGNLTLSGRANSPVGSPFTVTVPLTQLDANTITIEGRMYHRN